ncbi:MAG TPA: TonB-dependent receptor [Acidobacteriaceae bacterium]|nr:TonB-dependent receptor [Acidobacteriaceae bacterium]
MKTTFLKSFGLCATLCVFALSASVARGQATTGSILGQVTDSTGAVIPNVTVTATDVNKGTTFTSRTNGIGSYTILNATPGLYKVTASAPGFVTGVALNANLEIDQKLLLNFSLKVGASSTTVTVTSAPTLLQTQSAETGAVIETQDILDLPLFGRNFYDLTALVPGVVNASGGINSLNLSVSGQREYGNSVLVDGIESTTNRTQDVTVTPSVDSVQEFKVVTSAYNAEFGNASGGVIAIQTKSGTNRYHGDAYEFFRPNFTTARPYAFGGGSEPASILKQHNFGGTLGGPVKKDHSFFFGSYEGSRQKDAYTYLDSTIPFGLIGFEPDGSVSFANLVDPCAGQQCNGSGPPAGTIDPIFIPASTYACYGYCTSTQFPGNVIPAYNPSAPTGSTASPAGVNTLLNFFPKPNRPGIDNGWFDNFAVFSPTNDNNNQVDSRFDQNLGANDKMYLVFHWGNSNQLVTDPYHGATVVPGAGAVDFDNKEDGGNWSISATEDHTFGAHGLNEFRFGYLRYYQDQYSELNGTDYSTKYGYGNIAVPGYSATDSFPYVFLADGYFAGGSSYKPYHVLDANYQYTDNFTWTGIQRHEIKFGGDYRRLNSHPNFSLFPTGYDYYGSFAYAETSDLYGSDFFAYGPEVPGGWNYYGGSDLADLAMGLPEDVYIGLQLTNPHTQAGDLDLFLQDTYKVTSSLTLNYGLRYEYQTPYTEASNYMSNYDIASNTILVAGRGRNSAGLINSRKDDFGPRFGFAYQIDNKTVVRGGFGLFYSPENDGREDYLTKNAPFADQAAYTNWPYTFLGFEYVDDTGVPRNTSINIPQSGVIDPASLPNGNLETTYAVNPKLKTGNTDSFNLTLERQVGSSIAVNVSYVGSVAHALSYQIGDINANPANPNVNKGDNRLTTDLGKIQYLTDAGMANYNALEVKVTKRQSRNLSFLGSYTYGHSLDNGPSPWDLGYNNDSPQNPYNLRPEYGTSDSDVRQNFVFSGLWRLPFGQGQRYFGSWGHATNMILGGWQLNSIFNMRSGTPVNVVRGNNQTALLPGLRPNVTANPNLPRNKRTMLEYFNTSAFNVNGLPPTVNTPGDAGRNLVVGPGYVNLDASLFKEFPIEEAMRLQLRFEAFNATNTPHFANPDGNFSDGTFGQIQRESGSEANREVQIAAKFIF